MKKVIMDATVREVSFERSDREKGTSSHMKIRVWNAWGDYTGGDGHFFDVYGAYAETMEDKVHLQPGDVCLFIFEERNKPKVDASTGLPKNERKDYKYSIEIRRIAKANGSKVTTNVPAEAGLAGADSNDDTW